MKIPVILLIALSSLSASALDLSPRYITVLSDGINMRRPYFADGDKKYSVTLNIETELTPYDDGSLFRFIKLEHAEMRLRPSSFSVEIKFEPATLDRYQEAARKLLPQVANNVVLEQQMENPLPMNAWKSQRFVYSYTTPFGEFRESITFLNITPTTQVIVQVYAMAKNFADASERAYDIIRRWHELDPKAVLRGS